MIVAGLFVGIGRFGLAVGFAGGVVLWLLSSRVLTLVTGRIMTARTARQRAIPIVAHLAKYAAICALVWCAARYPQIDLVGLAGGYTLGLAGFIVTNIAPVEEKIEPVAPGT